MTIKNPLTEITLKLLLANHNRRIKQHEKQIEASQAKLAETKLVPGVVQIWC